MLYNEGQAITKIGFEQLSGRTTDVSGLAVCTCNPPDTRRGQWVQDCYYDYVDGIAGRPVLILPGGKDSADRRAADMFRDIWERIDTQGLLEEHAQGPNFYGWAASEIEWQWVRDDRLYNPVSFFTPRAETFRIAQPFDPYVQGAVPDELLVRVGYYAHEVERLIPGKWVVTPRTQVERRSWDGLMVTSSIYSLGGKVELNGDERASAIVHVCV